jgi:hypothetical protein
MNRSATELAFDPFDKCQTPDGNRFRPAIVSQRHTTLECLLDHFAVCSLKISRIGKAVQRG